MDEHRLMAVERVGAGFMRLRRDCLDQRIAAYPRLRLENPLDAVDANLHALFDTSIANGQFIGEDFTFCDRWRAIGGQVLIDLAMAFAHHGAAAHDEPLLKYLTKK